MALYCLRCNLELFDKDMSDFQPLVDKIREEGKDNQTYLTSPILGLCENCGLVELDNEGDCIEADCPKHGHPRRRQGDSAKTQPGNVDSESI